MQERRPAEYQQRGELGSSCPCTLWGPQHAALGGTAGMGEGGSTPCPPSDACTGFVLNTNLYRSHTPYIFVSLSKYPTLLTKVEPDPGCSGEDWIAPLTFSRNILLWKMRWWECRSNVEFSHGAVNSPISVLFLKAYSHGKAEMIHHVVFSASAPYLLWKSHKAKTEDRRNLPREQ